jgi:WD40 repeat protein/beta-lactamase regulating signal transducer with metallopeptidase domain
MLQRRSAATRHFVAASAIVGALALPILTIALPAWSVSSLSSSLSVLPPEVDQEIESKRSESGPINRAPVELREEFEVPKSPPSDRKAVDSAAAIFVTLPEPAEFDWSWWAASALVVWAVVATGLFVVQFVRLAFAWRFVRQCEVVQCRRAIELLAETSARFGVRRRVCLRESHRPLSPTTWGLFHPTIVLPRDHGEWSRGCLRSALWHEMAHVKRWDWFTQQLAQLACALYWFNPLIWLCARWLRNDAEHAADDAVVAAGVERTSYATQLVDIARMLRSSRVAVLGPAMARGSHLEHRVAAVLESQGRATLTRKAKLLLTLLAAAFLIGLATGVPAGWSFADDTKTIFAGPPEEERFAWQPDGLVDVFGTHRGKHWSEAYAVAYSSDSKLIATGSGDKVLRLWDAQSMRERVSIRLPGKPHSVAFSSNGNQLVAGIDGEIRFWELSQDAPKEIHRLTGFTGRVWKLTVSADGKRLAAICWPRQMRLFDLSGDRPLETHVLQTPDGGAWDLALSGGGNTLAAACGKSLVLWDLSGAEPRERARLVTSTGSVAISADGKTLASGGMSDDPSVHLWSLDSDTPRRLAMRRKVSQHGGIMAVAFSRDGLLASSTGYDSAIRLWKVRDDELHDLAVLKGHTSKTFELAFSPDGKQLASASSDHSLRVWTIDDQPRESEVSRRAHAVSQMSGVAFLPDDRSMLVMHSRALVTGRAPGIFDMRDRRITRHFELPAEERYYFYSMRLSPDAKILATTQRKPRPLSEPMRTGQSLASDESSVMFWDVASGKRLHTLSEPGYTGGLLAFSPDSRSFAMASEEGEIRVWDVVEGELVVAGRVEVRKVMGFAFANHNEKLVVLSETLTELGELQVEVKLWHLRDGELIAGQHWNTTKGVRRRRGYQTDVHGVVSSDGRSLAIQRRGVGAEIWELRDGEFRPRCMLDVADPQNYVHGFSHDRSMISGNTWGSRGNELSVWDTLTGKIIAKWPLRGAASYQAFSLDDRFLATANQNGTVYVLRIPARGTATGVAVAENKPAEKPSPAKESAISPDWKPTVNADADKQLAELRAAFYKENAESNKKIRAAKTNEEVDELLKTEPTEAYCQRFWDLAKKYSGTTAEREALLWICEASFISGSPKTEVIEQWKQEATTRLVDRYFYDKRLAKIVHRIVWRAEPDDRADVARKLIREHPHREVRGAAYLQLVRVLTFSRPQIPPADRAVINGLLNRIINEYGDVPYGPRKTLKQAAEAELAKLKKNE